MATRCPGTILAYLHVKIVTLSGLRNHVQCMGTRCPGTILAYLHVKVVKVSGFEELCPE